MSSGEVLVSLDIGTSEIKVIVGEVLVDSLNIIGVGTAKSKGMKKGAIVDIDQTVHAINSAVEQAEHMVEMSINRVIVGGQLMSLPRERVIIDIVAKQFIVDGLDEIRDPRGMIGVRLEMEGWIITCSKTVLHNILKCVERADLTITDICLQPLAAG